MSAMTDVKRAVAAGTAALAWAATGPDPRAAAALEVRVGAARVVEGSSGDRTVNVVVVLSEPAPAAVTIAYATRDGSATAGSDYRTASGTVAFAKGDASQTIAVNVIGDTAVEATEAFDVVLSTPVGAAIAAGTAAVTIVNDDFPPGQNQLAVYEVRFTFTGFRGALAGAEGCPVRRNGLAVMTGLVSGDERVPADDDIEYTGTLDFQVNLDLCEVHRVGGEDRLCAISVIGAGALQAQLAAYEGDRGGYIQAEEPAGVLVSSIFGSCGEGLIPEERKNFPTNSQANVFNGESLATVTRPLRVGRFVDPASPNMVLEVLRKIR